MKKLEIQVNLQTGVFLVKGANFKNWLTEEVLKLLAANSLANILIEPSPDDQKNKYAR